MGIGLDWGTSTVIASRRVPKKDEPEQSEIRTREQRNCYLPILKTDAMMKIIESSKINVVDLGKDDYVYAIGEDAINLANSMGTEIARPMSAGVLQGDLKALRIMQAIAKSVLREPKEVGETVVYSIPANPIDKNMNTMHHKGMAKKALETLGWTPEPIIEGLAVIYATAPVAVIDGQECKFTGIGISLGGGMVNVCIAYKGIDTLSFSLADALRLGQGSAGDWIDKRLFDAYGSEMGSEARCILYKENFADLNRISEDTFTYAAEVAAKSNIAPDDEDWHFQVLSALQIFYEGLMDYVIDSISKEFEDKKPALNGALDIILAGGSAIPNGFEDIFKQRIGKKKLPFRVGEIKKAVDPKYAVTKGCLIAAEVGYEGI
jgi:hypothetical protein